MGDAPRKLDEKNAAEVEAAFAAAPDEMIAQIIDGELSVLPRPAPDHSLVASHLGMDLGTLFHRGRGGPGGWIIVYEPELHFGPRPDRLIPDLAGWQRERCGEGGELAMLRQAYDLAPDWVCEVLSPSTERIDRGKKRDIYAREGVSFLWLVNPITQVLEVHRLEKTIYSLIQTFVGEEVVRAEPFDAVELPLASLWG